MTCPACRHPRAWRSRRRNVFERLISLVGVSAFRCERCHFRFFRWTPWHGGQPVRHSTPVADRRRHQRIAARVLIGIQWEDGQTTGTTTDVSVGGAGVESDAKVPEGTVLQLTFEPTEDGTAVGVSQAVVRSARTGKLGLEFVPLDEEEQERIGRLVQELLRTSHRS